MASFHLGSLLQLHTGYVFATSVNAAACSGPVGVQIVVQDRPERVGGLFYIACHLAHDCQPANGSELLKAAI